jgi:hypothetical protein
LRKSPFTPLSCSHWARPTKTFGAVDLRLHAASGGFGKIFRFGQRHAGLAGQLGQRLGGRMVAVLLRRSGEAEQFGGIVSPFRGARRLTASLPVVRVPVLSKMKALIRAAANRCRPRS